MKNRFLPFLFIMMLCTVASSRAQTTSLLYEISGNDLTKPSYLFGTIHIIPKEQFFFPETLEKAIEASDAVVLEIDMDIPIKDQLNMAQKMIIPNGKSLKDYLSEEDFKLVTQYLTDSIGISEKKMERYVRLKPIYLGSILLVEYYDNKVEAYDGHINKLAKKNNKDMLALETLDFQISMLDSITMEEQLEEMAEINTLMMEYRKMLNCYLKMQLDCLNESLKEEPKIEEQLLIKRNKNWVPIIKSWLEEKSLFIAVGAGHLPGDDGLIKLLEDEGYSVKPVEL